MNFGVEKMDSNMYNLAKELLLEIKPQCSFVAIAGSCRRKVENPRDIDFVIMNKYQDIILKDSTGVNWSGSKKVQHNLSNGVKVDLLFTDWESFGAALLFFTGPQNLNIRMRSKAKSMGMKLNEYGLFDSGERRIAGRKEKEIFKMLGFTYKIPADR